MKTKHTPAPWRVRTDLPQPVIASESGQNVFGIHSEVNAKRIVECVNAMEGIENPEVHLSHLAYQIEKAKQERNVAKEKYEDLRVVVNSLIALIDEGSILGPKSIIVQALRKTIQ